VLFSGVGGLVPGVADDVAESAGRDLFGYGIEMRNRVVSLTDRTRKSTRHQTRPGRATDRVRAVRTVEPDTSFREPVHCRGVEGLVSGVAHHPPVLLVGENEYDVGSVRHAFDVVTGSDICIGCDTSAGVSVGLDVNAAAFEVFDVPRENGFLDLATTFAGGQQ
jgi:hypothetical protein